MLEKSVVSAQDIRFILAEKYGLHEPEHITLLAGGSANCYRIDGPEGRFILKEFQSAYAIDDVKIESALTEFVRACGVPATRFIPTTTGEYVWEYRSHVFHLQAFVEGATFKQNAAPDWLLWESAHLLGRMHRVLLDFPSPLKEGFDATWFAWDVAESERGYTTLIEATQTLSQTKKREKI